MLDGPGVCHQTMRNEGPFHKRGRSLLEVAQMSNSERSLPYRDCEPLLVKRRLEHDMSTVQVCDAVSSGDGGMCEGDEEAHYLGRSNCEWPVAAFSGHCTAFQEGPMHTAVTVHDANRGLRRETLVRFQWSDDRQASGYVEVSTLLASVLSLMEGPDWRQNTPHASARVILKGKDLLRSPVTASQYFVATPTEALHVYYCKTS